MVVNQIRHLWSPPTNDWDPDARPDPVHYATPVPITADFGVTGLMAHAEWQDSSGLESARSLLEARYDLRIGIWDLASNPTLRQTLLDVTPVRPPPPSAVAVPTAAAKRAEARVDAKMAAKAAEEAASATIALQLGGLNDTGWIPTEDRERWLLRLLMSEQYIRDFDQEPYPLLQLELLIGKRTTSVIAFTILYWAVDLPAYVDSRRRAFEEIASPEKCRLGASPVVLLIVSGGWADDNVDWTERGEWLVGLTGRWRAAFADFIDDTRRNVPDIVGAGMTNQPTIIMVGGVFTTEDGTTLDSRQPMVGDPRGQVVYRTLSRSRLWWEVVRSLADSIVKSKPGSYALVDGPRQVFDLASDGGIKSLSLADFLAVGTPESNWHFPFGEFRAGRSPDEMYQGAAALVDISQANRAGAALLSHFGALLRRNPNQVLIVPHTHYLQEFFGRVALAGQSEQTLSTYADEHPQGSPASRREPNPLDYTSAVPVQAEFMITGLIQREAWQDPSDLEAARALLQSRYDLTIGLWDLASNPTLQSTLLDVVEVDRLHQ